MDTTAPEQGIAPFAIEAEMSVLGGMLIDPEAVGRAAELLVHDESAFYREAHRKLFRALVRLWEAGVEVDPITVAEALRDSGDFEAVGGTGYLAQLWDYTPSAANIEYHIGILRDKARRRRMLEAGAQIQQLARTEQVLSAALDEAERLVFGCAERADETDRAQLVKTAILPAIEKNCNRERGLEVGFEDVDRLTMGFEPGELVIIAGATSMGKSAFAWQAATHVAAQGKPVLGFSLEMTRAELVWRMLCAESMVDGLRLRRSGVEGYPEAAERLHRTAARLNTIPLWIDARSLLSVLDVRAAARRHAAEHGIGLIVVDHLQIMADDAEERHRGLARITAGLKALAKELSCPVFALSQLSRFKERAEKRPQLSDLRESGAIEENADAVLLLYRPEYYHGPTDKQGNNLEGKAEVIVAKRRNGATGTIDLFFRKECVRFEDVAHRRGGRG